MDGWSLGQLLSYHFTHLVFEVGTLLPLRLELQPLVVGDLKKGWPCGYLSCSASLPRSLGLREDFWMTNDCSQEGCSPDRGTEARPEWAQPAPAQRPAPAGTHIDHEEARGQHVAPGQGGAAHEVLAPAAEAGKLPPQEGEPGGRGKGSY